MRGAWNLIVLLRILSWFTFLQKSKKDKKESKRTCLSKMENHLRYFKLKLCESKYTLISALAARTGSLTIAEPL